MSLENFFELVEKQLSALYIINSGEIGMLRAYSDKIASRMLTNCKHINNKYYSDIEALSPYHSCQYLMFLYFAANTIYNETGTRQTICDKLYNLSKVVSSSDLYYEIKLPEIFAFDHPVGTVLGRANYNDYFFFSQGVTVGNNNGLYPTFGKCVLMLSNSKVLGKCNIGNNVIIAADAYIKDRNIPDNSVVFGKENEITVKPLKALSDKFFGGMGLFHASAERI